MQAVALIMLTSTSWALGGRLVLGPGFASLAPLAVLACCTPAQHVLMVGSTMC